MIGLILGLVVGSVLVVGLVVAASFSLLTFARRIETGVEERYGYAGEVEGREIKEVEGDHEQNIDINQFPGWELGNSDQNRIATAGAPNDW
jgi:hypothetical protein